MSRRSNKKKLAIAIICFITIIVLFSICGKTGIAMSSPNWKDSVKTYQNLAQMGDGEAYFKLACCYNYGRGVESNVNMALNMAIMAKLYGGIKNLTDFISYINDNRPIYMLVYALEKVKMHNYDEAYYVGDGLKGIPGARAIIIGAIALEQGQEEEAIKQFGIARDEKNVFGYYMLTCYTDTFQRGMDAAELMPSLYNVLGNNNIHDGGIGLSWIYYMMADRDLSLGPLGARRLLEHYKYLEERGIMMIDSNTKKRLRNLSNKGNKEETVL